MSTLIKVSTCVQGCRQTVEGTEPRLRVWGLPRPWENGQSAQKASAQARSARLLPWTAGSLRRLEDLHIYMGYPLVSRRQHQLALSAIMGGFRRDCFSCTQVLAIVLLLAAGGWSARQQAPQIH